MNQDRRPYIDSNAGIWSLDGDLVLLPVTCGDCGALVVDRPRHDAFHASVSRRRWWSRS